LAVIGNKNETYAKLRGLPYAKAEEWAKENEVRSKAFAKHVTGPRLAKSQAKEPPTAESTRLTPYEILGLLGVKKYCCRSLFLTYVDIPLPDPDYLERTFSRVKFLNKRSREEAGGPIELGKLSPKSLKKKMEKAIIAR
jgi:hypothetical protein